MRLLNLLLINLLALPVQANTLTFEGQAFDPESQTLLYSERHEIERDADGRYLRSRVAYFHPDGSPLGTKQVDFNQQPFLPSLSFEDYRTGMLTRLETSSKVVTLKKTQAGEDRIVQELTLGSDTLLIADAGFDRMVTANWDALIQGQTLGFEFVTLGRGRLVDLQMRLTGQDGTHAKFEVEAQNWLFRMVMDPIRLTYDLKQQQLLEYTGVTNIPIVENGKPTQDNLKARIVYRY